MLMFDSILETAPVNDGVARWDRAVEELRAKGWRASRGAYQGMIAVMGRHEDWHGVLDVSRLRFSQLTAPLYVVFAAYASCPTSTRCSDLCGPSGVGVK